MSIPPLCSNWPRASGLSPLLHMQPSLICHSRLLVIVTICMTIPLAPCECLACYTLKGSSCGAFGEINQMSVFWLISLKSIRNPQCGWSPWNQPENCDTVDFAFRALRHNLSHLGSSCAGSMTLQRVLYHCYLTSSVGSTLLWSGYRSILKAVSVVRLS